MKKVMIVDDEYILRKVLCKMLTNNDMDTLVIGCYDNAVAALEGMVDEVPDILITDVKMPVMNGIELIGRAKEMHPFLQCVIISGYDEFSLAQAAMMEGVRHYLLKPCTEEKLRKVIEECTAQAEKEKKILLQDDRYRELSEQRIVTDLQKLLQCDRKISAQDIEEIAASYDKSLLREAAVILVLKFLAGEDKREATNMISQIFEGEHIYRNIAGVLEELSQKVCRNLDFVEQIRRYVNENYQVSNLSLRYVAENVAYMNVQYVGKQFIKKVGMRFSDYLLMTRMNAAKEMLVSPADVKMYEVAESVGLGKNIQYFYQLFKEYNGLTPKEYRENNRKKS